MVRYIVWDLGDTLVTSPDGGQDLRPLDEYPNIQLRPFAHEVLQLLSEKNFVHAVLSNTAVSDSEVARRMLRRLGILDQFAYVFATASELDETKPEKPDASVFQLVLNELGAQPVEAVMVGNSWDNDILGANGVGMHSIWLTNSKVSVRKDNDSRVQCPPWIFPVFDLVDIPVVLSLLDESKSNRIFC